MAPRAALLTQLVGAGAGADWYTLPSAPPWLLSARQQQLATYEVLLVSLLEDERRAARRVAAEARARAAAQAALPPELASREASWRGLPAQPPAAFSAPRRSASVGPRLPADAPRAGAGAGAESALEMAYRAGAATLEGLSDLGRAASFARSASVSSPASRAPPPPLGAAPRAGAALGDGEQWRLAFGFTRREHSALAAGMRPPGELRANELFADGTITSVHYHLLLLSLRRPHHFAGPAEFASWAERRLAHVASALCCALAEADLEEAADLGVEGSPQWNVPALLGAEPAGTAALRTALVRVARAAARQSSGRKTAVGARQDGVGRLMMLPSPARRPPVERSASLSRLRGGAPPPPALLTSRSDATVSDQSDTGGAPDSPRTAAAAMLASWNEEGYVASIQQLNQAAWQIYAQLEARGASLGCAAIQQRLPVTFPYSALVWAQARARALDQVGDGGPEAVEPVGLGRSARRSRSDGGERGAAGGALLPVRAGGEGAAAGAEAAEEAAEAADEAEAAEEAEAEAAADGDTAAYDAQRLREQSVEAAARRLLRPLGNALKLSARRRALATASVALERWCAAPLGKGSELELAALARALRTLQRRHFAGLVRAAGVAAGSPGAARASSAPRENFGGLAEAARDAAWARALCAEASARVRQLLLDYHEHAREMRRRSFRQLVDAFALAFLAGRALTLAMAGGAPRGDGGGGGSCGGDGGGLERTRGRAGSAGRGDGGLHKPPSGARGEASALAQGGAIGGGPLAWPPWDEQDVSSAGDEGAGAGGGDAWAKRAPAAPVGSGAEQVRSARGKARQLAGLDAEKAAAEAAAILWPGGARAEDADLASSASDPFAHELAPSARVGREQHRLSGAGPKRRPPPPGAAPPSAPAANGGAAEVAEAADAPDAPDAPDARLALMRARKQRADALYKCALAANSEGDFRAARDLFDRSHALEPNWATVVSTANMRLKLGEVGIAVELYEALLRAHAEAPPSQPAGTGAGSGGRADGGGGVPAGAAGGGAKGDGFPAASVACSGASGGSAGASSLGSPTAEQAAKARAKVGDARSVRDAWRKQLLAGGSTDAAVAEGATDARTRLSSLAAAARAGGTGAGDGGDGDGRGGAQEDGPAAAAAALREALLSCACVSAQAVFRRLMRHASPPLGVEALAELTAELRDAALLEVSYFGPALDAHVLAAGLAAPAEPTGSGAPAEPAGRAAPAEPAGSGAPAEPAGRAARAEPAGGGAAAADAGPTLPAQGSPTAVRSALRSASTSARLARPGAAPGERGYGVRFSDDAESGAAGAGVRTAASEVHEAARRQRPAPSEGAALIALRVYGTAYAQIAAASLRKLGAAVDAAGARPGRAEEQVDALERSLPLWPSLAELDGLLMAHGGRRAPLLPTHSLLEPLVREWVNYQSARFSDRLELLVAEETWAPLDDTGAAGWHAASVVDLFSLFLQTIKAFLAMPLPHTAEWSHDICRVADLICNQYVNRMLQQLGPRSRLLPPRPRPEIEWLDKAKGVVWRGAVAASKGMPPIALPPMPPMPSSGGAAAASWSGLLNQISGAPNGTANGGGSGALNGGSGGCGSTGSAAGSRGAQPSGAGNSGANGGSSGARRDAAELARSSTAAATMSVQSMCVRINSLVFARAQLATLRGFVLGAWERLHIADAQDSVSGERYAHTLLHASDATLRLAAREVSAHMGLRVCFLDTRRPFLERLHAQPPHGPGVQPGAFRALLEQLLSPALETVLELVEDEPARMDAILGVCCAAASAYERVLLDGGQHRIFAPCDAPILRADAEALCAFFIARDRHGVVQGLPEDLVESATCRLHAVLDLFEVSSETLISKFASAPETDKLKAVTQLNLARVLVHRPDELARKWARDRAKQIADLLGKHEQTNCFADELLPQEATLGRVSASRAEEEAESAGAEDAASLPIPPPGMR